MKIYFDKVKLAGGRSLIIPHLPETMTLDQVAKKMATEKKSVASFGLFDTAQPNFQTYYPGVKAEDLKPQNAEFIHPIFRALSETIVHKRWNPIDFGKNGILKASMQKLLGQTVYANHEAAVGNEIGAVSKVSWQAGYTTEDGIKVPAGINAEFKIDGKAHPTIARGIMMDPPAIHSNSVTVSFAWEKSHPKMDDDTFRAKLGKKADDGELVRRVVTNVINFHETSLVAHGADPYAQIVDNKGAINNPFYADTEQSLSEAKRTTQVYFFDYKTDTLSFSAEEETETETEIETQQNTAMKELLARLSIVFAFASDVNFASLSEADQEKKVNEEIKRLQAEAKKAEGIAALTTERDNLKTELSTLKTEKEKLEPNAKIGEKALTALRTDVLRMYKVLNPTPDETVLNTLNAADHSALETFQKTYQSQMDSKYPAHCNSCNSTDVSRNSVITEAPKAGETTPAGDKKTLSNADVAASFQAPSAESFSVIHGEKKKEEKK